MKKILSAFIVLAMMVVMVIPGFSSSMSITTSVPYEHKVVVTHNDGGYVLVNGKICPDGTQFNINRFGEISLSFVFKNGYHLDNVEVNGMDVTDKLVSGILKISDINSDVLIKVTFEKCSSDPDDKCGKVDMEGAIYLGEKEVKGAELSFDFGSVTAKTDADGRYFIKDIADGKHLVTISKDGEVLANTAFIIERADVDKVTLSTASDGTQIAIIPLDAEKIYLDFNIVDNDKNGIPDKDPDDTDPGDPDNPDFEDPDKPNVTPDPDDYDGTPDGDNDNDGVVITIGGPKKDVPVIPIPDTFVEIVENPIVMCSLMGLSLFFFILIFFKRKKDEEEESESIVQ